MTQEEMTPKNKIPLLVILGPTATGKSDLAVEVAHRIAEEAAHGKSIAGYSGAEIISADSRQVYKGLDIGTGKITKEEMRGIPHHCLDIADPASADKKQERFTVMDWKKCAEKAIEDITAHEDAGDVGKKLPIICGGTGFYISTLIDGLEFPDIEIDPTEQAELEVKTADELFAELKKLDPRRAKDMENGGAGKNKRRLMRAILIARKLGAVPALKINASTNDSKYLPIIIGVTMPDADIKKRIMARVLKRLAGENDSSSKAGSGDDDMIEEARKLHAGDGTSNLSYERMHELGLEYRYLAKYLQGQLTREQFIEQLATKIWQFARRQKAWFKRDKRTKWFDPRDPTTPAKILEEIKITPPARS